MPKRNLWSPSIPDGLNKYRDSVGRKPNTLPWITKLPIPVSEIINTYTIPVELSGGINNGVHPLRANENQLVTAVNLLPESYPSLSRVGKDTAVGTAPEAADVRSILVIDPDNHILVAISDSLYKWNGSSWSELASGLGSTLYFDFASIIGNHYIVDGSSQVKKYDGSSLSTLGDSPSGGESIVAHANRLYVSEGRNLHYCDLRDPTDWTTVDEAGTIEIEGFFNEDISCLAVVADHVIILKEMSIYELYGTGPDDYEIYQVTSSRGCISPRSVQVVNEILLFLAHDGIVMYDGGVNPVLISNPLVQDTIESINTDQLDIVCSSNDGRFYQLCIPTGTSTSNDTIINYDTLTKTFYTGDSVYTAMASYQDRVFVGNSSGLTSELGSDSPHSSGTWSLTKVIRTARLTNRETIQEVDLVYELLDGDGSITVALRDGIETGSYTTIETLNTLTTEPTMVRLSVVPTTVYDNEWGLLKISGSGSAIIHSLSVVMRVRED